jgi:NitT/TauT family transport system substrate-binding protein
MPHRIASLDRVARLLACVLSAWFWSATAWSRPLRVAYTHWFACVPLGIADDKQYWRDVGLQVQLRGYQTSQEVIEALTNGEVDVAYDMLATWVDVGLRGVPISIVAETDWSNGGDKLLVRNGVSLADHKGRPIAVYLRGSALMLFLREGLAREKLGVPDFPIIEVPEQEKGLELFSAGKVDAIVTNEPWASRVEQAGARTLATTADFPGVSPEGFAVRAGQVDEATLQQFFSAWFRAVGFLHDPANAEAVAKIASIYAFAGTEAITPADVALYARITPIHDPAGALKENDLEQGNVGSLIQRLGVLRRLQGKPVSEKVIQQMFSLAAVRVAAARPGVTPLAAASSR